MRLRTCALALSVAALSACTPASSTHDAAGPANADAEAGSTASHSSPAAPVRLVAQVGPHPQTVALTQAVSFRVENATLGRVRVSASRSGLAGALSADGSVWRATGRLEPNTTYTVHARAIDSEGEQRTLSSSFTTETLPLSRETYPSIAPLDGETVGVGMPVIITFDVPVTDKAAIEKHLAVTSSPAQKGAWHWISDQEVHWRPATYWQPGTQVTVDADINSIPAGNGIYGQLSRETHFSVGDSHVYRVNAATHQMQVLVNGSLVRTIAITTGKPGFTTRSGTKVIIEKFRSKRMNSETVGIAAGSPDAYDIDNVEYAMRVTYSGEFIHAAPWSVGSQGYANVSHGCTGMSTANAQWLYDLSRRGDVVEYTGTDRYMTLTNGYGDWNESFPTYAAGSALR